MRSPNQAVGHRSGGKAARMGQLREPFAIKRTEVYIMQNATNIRILENDNNRKGDLFGRLMADLMIALGYEQPRINIHKSGRELDLSADHRLEPRRAIAECKATSETIGGADLNKFVGALDAEHEDRDKRPITGYFISLAGFKETAIEQERKRRRTKILMLSGSQVVDELVKGRILIAKERATELAGRCCAEFTSLDLDPETELLAHERGWIWAIYYTTGKARTHFVLIHADGTVLAHQVANDVITSDVECGGFLNQLTCLNPTPPLEVGTDVLISEALVAYKQYISNECGDIQLDGLPADTEVGSRRLKLENLFIPLHLDVITGVNEKQERQPIGSVLEQHQRLAILAAPGGGKSTLIKRLAVAYTDSGRREKIADGLPQKDWLPLYFRCRELRNLARGSFSELLDALSQREQVRQHASIFRTYIDSKLLSGHVLLLVDGLDEISDPGDRAAFVCTLRTALQAYPGVAIIITSREAGFRHVAAHLAPVCTHSMLSPFNKGDIRRLCVAWHREVVGDNEKVEADAKLLAATISKNDRIHRLAVNPLLLTTLLLVKRWVGSLPTRRAVLYGKAVELLLMTWNTEGHDPIPEEEALPQLCYVASEMMLSGVQKISRPRLAVLLQEARDSLPTELGYVKDTVDKFIHRVEDRSSLMMMTGHDIENGQLVEFFEFRHLTFQEFLTARALVMGWHPGRNESDTLVKVLEPFFDKEEWREVIPLAAVLGGKATEGLIQRLTMKVKKIDNGDWLEQGDNSLLINLGNCLADEAAARPETIRAAIYELLRFGGEIHHKFPFTPALARGRYGKDFREGAREAYINAFPDYVSARHALMSVVWWQSLTSEDSTDYKQAILKIIVLLESQDSVARSEGALGCVMICTKHKDYDVDPLWLKNFEGFTQIQISLFSMLYSDNTGEQHSAAWALGLLACYHEWDLPDKPDILSRLFMIWRHSSDIETQEISSWSIAHQHLASRDNGHHCVSVDRAEVESILKSYNDLIEEEIHGTNEKTAALVVAWYVRALSDEEIARRLQELVIELDDESSNYHLGKELLEVCIKGAVEQVPTTKNKKKLVKEAPTKKMHLT